MDDIAEKRVFTQNTAPFRLVIQSDLGTVYVSVADDRVGEMELIDRRTPNDIAVTDSITAIATDTDVFIWDGTTLDETSFGPATAVDYHEGTLRAATPTGVIKRRMNEWETIGQVDAPITVLDADFIGTTNGVYRTTDSMPHVGLADVNDITTETLPMVATNTGLFELGNGWMKQHTGTFTFVQAHPHDPAHRAHAATADECYERTDAWRPLNLPTTDPIADATYTDQPILLTETGTIYFRDTDNWTSHTLGITHPTKILTIRPDT